MNKFKQIGHDLFHDIPHQLFGTSVDIPSPFKDKAKGDRVLRNLSILALIMLVIFSSEFSTWVFILVFAALSLNIYKNS